MGDPATDTATSQRFSEQLGDYLRRTQGRGYHCTTEIYKRGQLHYFFAFPEDYARAEQDYEGPTLVRRPHRRAFEIVFVYDGVSGTLDLYATGGKKVCRDLQRIFASIILRQEIEDTDRDDRVYELDPLRRPDFRFSYDPSWGIASVDVRRLRLSLMHAKGRKVTVEAASQAELLDLYRTISIGADWLQAKISVVQSPAGR